KDWTLHNLAELEEPLSICLQSEAQIDSSSPDGTSNMNTAQNDFSDLPKYYPLEDSLMGRLGGNNPMSPISQDYQSLYKVQQQQHHQQQALPPDLNDISLYGLDNENLSPPTSQSPQYPNSSNSTTIQTTIPSIVFTDCSGGGDFNR
uniref:Uncharacterized protein n=1 Tax=Megaselia scalaris TaxID=36166 RepID=T1GWI2_MEGSC